MSRAMLLPELGKEVGIGIIPLRRVNQRTGHIRHRSFPRIGSQEKQASPEIELRVESGLQPAAAPGKTGRFAETGTPGG
jgi:hypothetical protein